MQQELPFYRSKTFHRKKIMVMFTAVFLALLFLMGRLVYLMVVLFGILWTESTEPP